jgi:hypothetical protein
VGCSVRVATVGSQVSTSVTSPFKVQDEKTGYDLLHTSFSICAARTTTLTLACFVCASIPLRIA